MQDYQSMLKEQIEKRLGRDNQAYAELERMNRQQQALTRAPVETRRDLSSYAQFVDDTFGGNLASTVDKPESVETSLRRAIQTRMQTPRSQGLEALQAGLQNEENLRKALGNRLRQLSASDVMKVQEGDNIPTLLNGIERTISSNSSIFGPVSGRLHGLNPYDEQTRTVDAEMRAASQAFGRYMEGGVLRKEDEEKYRKMFPSLSDTPEVANGKLQVVRNLLNERQKGNINALRGAGFDMQAFAGSPSLSQPQQSSGSIEMSQMSDEELKRIIGGR